jgi:hypothetical protein
LLSSVHLEGLEKKATQYFAQIPRREKQQGETEKTKSERD